MSLKWKVLNQYIGDKDVITLLLENRQIVDTLEQEKFLNPPPLSNLLPKLPSDFKLALKQARDLVNDYIKQGLPILIYGDYDADGVCATAILYNTLRHELSHNKVFFCIPNRFTHGYGLSEAALVQTLENIEASGTSTARLLVITVDTGITAVNEIKYLRDLGYDVILTDHHQKSLETPSSSILVWNDSIVGSTIAWLLSIALGSKDRHNIALAGVATVTDVQPLLGINRSLVKQALQILNSDPPKGIRYLLDNSGSKSIEITTYELGWVIGPRLNATGRLTEADDSLKLLISDNDDDVKNYARLLNDTNVDRQSKTLDMYEIASDFALEKLPKIIVSSSEQYHEGLIGLVASRLVKKYHVPSIVISIEGATAKGSVRSVSGIDIISILRLFENEFLKLGGHPMAAGFSIETKNISKLQDLLVAYFDKNIPEDLLQPVLEIDLELPASVINLDFIESLARLKPFGISNPEPRFLTRSLGLSAITKMGAKGQHYSFKLYDGSEFHKAIFFNSFDHTVVQQLRVGDKVDVVFKVKENNFNGRKSVDLLVDDLVICN